MYKTGDTVTLGASPAINLGNYNSLKPSASITRVLGDNPEAEIKEMESTLQESLVKATLAEAGFCTDVAECLELGGLDAIQQYCTQQLNDIKRQPKEVGGTRKLKRRASS
jgi:hypothetical protein